MNQTSPASQYTRKHTLVLRIYLPLVVFGGIITLGYLLKIPTEAKNSVFLGLSKERMLMVGGILVVILIAGIVLISSWVRKPLFARLKQKLIIIILQQDD